MISLTGLFGGESEILREHDFQLLLTSSVVAPLGTALISPILDSLTGPYGVSAARIGLMVTAFAAPAVILIPILGIVADRVGRKPVLVFGLVTFGTAGTAMAFVTDFRLVLVLRFCQGIGFSGTIPIVITAVGDLYAGDREATGQGLRFAVSGVSQAVFPVMAGLLVVASWRYPFFVYALAVPIAAMIFLRFEEPTGIRDADGGDAASTPKGGQRRAGPEPAAADSTATVEYLRHLLVLAAERHLGAVLIARGLAVVPFIGFLTYNSLVVVRLFDGSPGLAGITVATFSLVYAAAATQAGRIAAAFGEPTLPLVTANGCLAVGLVTFTLAPNHAALFGGVVVLGAGIGILLSLYRTLITGFATESLRGGLVSVGESLGRLAATVTPLAMGGSIALLEPRVGPEVAIELTVLGAALVGAGPGIACILVARSALPWQE